MLLDISLVIEIRVPGDQSATPLRVPVTDECAQPIISKFLASFQQGPTAFTATTVPPAPIVPVQVGGDSATPPLTIREYIDKAFDMLGDHGATPKQLADEMLRMGWETRSNTPADVVSSTLREKRGNSSRQYEPVGNGYWIRVDGVVALAPQRRPHIVQPAPGMSQCEIAERVLRAEGHGVSPEALFKLMQERENYQSSARDPLDTLNSTLYRRKNVFKRVNGNWHLAEWLDRKELTEAHADLGLQM